MGERPSGPGAFEGCIWKRALAISSSLNSYSKKTLSLSSTHGRRHLMTTPMSEDCDVVKSLEKYPVTTPCTALKSDVNSPFSFSSLSTLLRSLSLDALLWKKRVFLSPSWIQISRERCLHIISSLSNHSSVSSSMLCSIRLLPPSVLDFVGPLIS
ncbi:hypothetical protein SLE2022_211280 [Rubroshorea leprosula]